MSEPFEELRERNRAEAPHWHEKVAQHREGMEPDLESHALVQRALADITEGDLDQSLLRA